MAFDVKLHNLNFKIENLLLIVVYSIQCMYQALFAVGYKLALNQL